MSEGSGKHLATIDDVLLDHESGKILALKVHIGFIFLRRRIVMLQDIRHISNKNLYVEDARAIINSTEVVRVHKKLPTAFSWLHLPVYTKQNKMIGRVEDIVLEMMLGYVVRIYVKKEVMGMVVVNSYIVPFERIVKISQKKIVINDNIQGYKIKTALMRNLAKVTSNTAPVEYGQE